MCEVWGWVCSVYLYGVEDELSDPLAFHVDEVRLEQRLRGFKPLAPHFDHSPVR